MPNTTTLYVMLVQIQQPDGHWAAVGRPHTRLSLGGVSEVFEREKLELEASGLITRNPKVKRRLQIRTTTVIDTRYRDL